MLRRSPATDTGYPALGIYNYICGRHQVFPCFLIGLDIVVICNDHLQPQLLCQGNLADGGNAVVTGYNGLYPVFCRSLNDMLVDTVARPGSAPGSHNPHRLRSV